MIRTEFMKWIRGQNTTTPTKRRAQSTRSLRATNVSSSPPIVSRQIHLGGHSIPLRHITSTRRRKTLSLRIRSSGITITTPRRCTTATIDCFVRSKQQWILDHWLSMRQGPIQDLRDGAILHCVGQELTLRLISHASPRTRITSDQTDVIVTGSDHSEPKLKTILTKRYKQQAQQNLIPLTRELIQEYGFDPSLRIAIKSYKAAYGKCRGGTEILLNYRIVMFPVAIIRHIILHELAHTRHMNHSKQFRDCLKQLDPQTDQHRLRLRQHGGGYLE